MALASGHREAERVESAQKRFLPVDVDRTDATDLESDVPVARRLVGGGGFVREAVQQLAGVDQVAHPGRQVVEAVERDAMCRR